MSIRKNTPFNSPFWHVRKQSSSYAVGGILSTHISASFLTSAQGTFNSRSGGNVIAHISIEGADYEHDATVWGWYSTRYKSHLFVHLQINSGWGVRTSPIYNALIFNNIKMHHVRTPWIRPNRGQSVIKQFAVHKKPLFRGQGLEKQLVIHKIPPFCGWGIEKRAVVHKRRLFCGQARRNDVVIHKMGLIRGRARETGKST